MGLLNFEKQSFYPAEFSTSGILDALIRLPLRILTLVIHAHHSDTSTAHTLDSNRLTIQITFEWFIWQRQW